MCADHVSIMSLAAPWCRKMRREVSNHVGCRKDGRSGAHITYPLGFAIHGFI